MEDFQQAHEKATEMLDAAESEAGESLRPLGKTPGEIKAESEAIMEKMVEPITACIKKHAKEIGTYFVSIEEEARLIREALMPLMPNIPENIGQGFASAVLRNEDWKEAFEDNPSMAGKFFSTLLSLLSEGGSVSSFEFEENDFPYPHDCFGISLKEPLALTLHGNTGDFAGYSMDGGTIIVEQNAGRWAGWDMQSGTLDIRGEAQFDASAFNPQNKGTIIWKGVRIWENGEFTPAGQKMSDGGMIWK